MNYITKTMIVSVVTNTLLSIMKIITGIVGKANSLIADGIHSFSDLITDVISIVGAKLSNKPADDKHPYGHGNLEYLTSIIIGIVIILLGLSIIKESVARKIVIPSIIVALVSLITVVVKYLLSKYILGKGKKYNNNILIASGKESMTDAISSIVVFLSIILMQFSKYIKILKYADMISSIFIGICIIKIGFEILKINVSTILGEQITDQKYLEKIINTLKENDEVQNISNLVILKYGPYLKLSVDIEMNPDISLLEANKETSKLESILKKKDKKLTYVSINVKPFIEEEKIW